MSHSNSSGGDGLIFMKKLMINVFLCVFINILSYPAYAILNMELTHGVLGTIPIAIVPFETPKNEMLPQDITNIIKNDLQNSGRFKVNISLLNNIKLFIFLTFHKLH